MCATPVPARYHLLGLSSTMCLPAAYLLCLFWGKSRVPFLRVQPLTKPYGSASMTGCLCDLCFPRWPFAYCSPELLPELSPQFSAYHAVNNFLAACLILASELVTRPRISSASQVRDPRAALKATFQTTFLHYVCMTYYHTRMHACVKCSINISIGFCGIYRVSQKFCNIC